MRGRKNKINDFVTGPDGQPLTCAELIVRAIRSGQTCTVASMVEGIDYAIFAVWMNKGARQRSEQCRDLREAVLKAQAAEIRIVNSVYRCVEGYFQVMKRRFQVATRRNSLF